MSAEISKQLKTLAARISGHGKIPDDQVGQLVSDEFACGDLRPRSLRTVFSDATVRVERPKDALSGERQPGEVRFRGWDGFVTALRDFREPLQGPIRATFKLFRFQDNGDTIITKQYLTVVGSSERGRLEENAVWSTEWHRSSKAEKFTLGWIGVEDFERSTLKSDAPMFVDCTESILGDNESYRKQLLYGFDYWLERIQEIWINGTPGLALGDVNGDGRDDLYICQEAGLPNLLYVQNQDGTARDASQECGANWLEGSRSALLVDFDNDGDQDLAVAVFGNVVFCANDGHGRFALRTVLPTPHDNFSLSAADYDNDGDLDVYICCYEANDLTASPMTLSIGGGAEFVYHDANNGAPNSLLRNDVTPKEISEEISEETPQEI